MTTSKKMKMKLKNRTRKHSTITGISGRGSFLKDWKNQKPTYLERKKMSEKCGKKCFLGPKRSFPICTRKTCKPNRKGVYAAFIRAQEYKTLRNQDKYRRISANARRLLDKRRYLHYYVDKPIKE